MCTLPVFNNDLFDVYTVLKYCGPNIFVTTNEETYNMKIIEILILTFIPLELHTLVDDRNTESKVIIVEIGLNN